MQPVLYALPPGASPVQNQPQQFNQHFIQQVVTPGQPVSVIPEPMFSAMKWIEKNTEEHNRTIFSAKDMNVPQMIQILYDLVAQWNIFFEEYSNYGETIAAEPEFLSLQQTCGLNTLKLLKSMKNIKAGVKSYSGSTRLKSMAQDLKKKLKVNVDHTMTIGGGVKARVDRTKGTSYVAKDQISVQRKQPSVPNAMATNPVNTSPYNSSPNMSPQIPHMHSNPQMVQQQGFVQTNPACFSCHNALAPGQKFCGSCGTMQVQAPPQQPAAPAMKFCGNCGTQGANRFCGSCGSPM